MKLVAPHTNVDERVIERLDFWRRSPATAGGEAGHKEWSYFCIPGAELQFVAAFAIFDRTAESIGALEEGRIVTLVRTDDARWHGTVDRCAPASMRLKAGAIDARFGGCSLSFRGGAYHLALHTAPRDVDAELVLRPAARAALTRSVPLGANAPMHWVVVPRLVANGQIRAGGRVHRVHDCPAYHDHNWGRFVWGDDFAWEWGIVLGASDHPWSLVYYRITNRGRHAVLAQGVLVWHGSAHTRSFRDADLAVTSAGLLRGTPGLRVPPVVHLAAPGLASDLPQQIVVDARCDEDVLQVVLTLRDFAQVGLPDDMGTGVTLISEAAAHATVTGRLRGTAVAFDAPAVVEFHRGA